MSQAYTLSIASLLIFFIFLLCIFIIRKRKKFIFFFLLGASLLPLFSIFRTGVYESGDFAINIEKAVDLYHSLSYGIFPVNWAFILNANYGYPLFIFTYPLPYYSIVLFKLAGFSFIDSEKIIMAGAYILSGTGMYFFAKKFFKPLPSLAVAIFYLYAPYHLVDLHFRVALGELFAYAAIPYVLLSLFVFVKKQKFINGVFISISYSALLLSHQAITLVVTPFLLLTIFFLNQKIGTKMYACMFLIVGVLATTFYWLPVLSELQYTHQMTYSQNISFENPQLYLVSPWKFGLLFQGPVGQLSFPIGFIQLTLLFISIFLLLSGKVKENFVKPLILLLLTSAILFFLLFPLSERVWKILPFMTNFQFAYRLMLPISLVTAVIGGIVMMHIKNPRIVYLIIFISIFSTILNWGGRRFIADITETYLVQHASLSTYEAEGLQPAAPKWTEFSNPWIQLPPKEVIEMISGEGTIKKLKRTPISHEYLISSQEHIAIQENTLYFPGWNLYINGKKQPIVISKKPMGTIQFTLTPGVYHVSLQFEDTPVRSFSKIISLCTLSLLGILAVHFKISKYVR